MASEELLPNIVKSKQQTTKSKKCCKWFCQVTSEAFLEEEDLLHYIGRVETSLSKSVIGAVILIISYALSVMSLTVGILRLGKCPCQPVLPIFLIVHGIAMSVRCIFETSKHTGNSKKEPEDGTCSPLHTLSKLCGVLIAFWTITGSIWVYGVSSKVDLQQATSVYYCDTLVYWYSLVLVSIVLVALILKGVFLITISMIYCNYENKTWYSQLMTESLGEFV